MMRALGQAPDQSKKMEPEQLLGQNLKLVAHIQFFLPIAGNAFAGNVTTRKVGCHQVGWPLVGTIAAMSPIASVVVPSSNSPIIDPGSGSARTKSGKGSTLVSMSVVVREAPAPVRFMLGDQNLETQCVYAYMPSQAHAMRWHMHTSIYIHIYQYIYKPSQALPRSRQNFLSVRCAPRPPSFGPLGDLRRPCGRIGGLAVVRRCCLALARLQLGQGLDLFAFLGARGRGSLRRLRRLGTRGGWRCRLCVLLEL